VTGYLPGSEEAGTPELLLLGFSIACLAPIVAWLQSLVRWLLIC
jgi:hypothetical protein